MFKTKALNLFRLVFKNRFLEEKLALLTQGKSKNSFFSKLPLNYTEYKAPSCRLVERNGIRYNLDISDYMEWLVFFGIEFEPRNVLYEMVGSDDVVFDVGANIGELSLNFAKRTTGKVYSFEPDPLIASKLKRNLDLNSFTNVILNQVGFGSESGRFSMSAEVNNNKGGNRIIASGAPASAAKVTIQKMDDFVDDLQIEQLDLIKIDVEGFELKVLEGGATTIEKFRPKLFIEVNDRNLRQQGNSPEQLISFVRNYYSTLRFAYPGYVTDRLPDLNNCHFDLIALPDEN